MNTAWTVALASLGTLTAVASAIAAIGAMRSARGTERATVILAQIEQNRLHTELTPQFDTTCTRNKTGGAHLEVTFTGPVGLDRLDGVSLIIRNDRANRSPSTAGSPELDEIRATIWGPLRFRPHVDHADNLGRAIPATPFARQETRRFALDDSLVPHWYGGGSPAWTRDYAAHPLRLEITCTRDGYQSWVMPIDVPIAPDPTAVKALP